MSAATILTILSIVNGLFGVVTEAPAVVDEIKSLLAKIAPHVDGTNAEVKRAFESAQAKLQELGK